MKKVAKFDIVSEKQFTADMEEFIMTKGQISEMYKNLKKPQRATKDSAGYDFFAPFDFILQPGQSIKVPTGIRVHITEGWFLGILPRSGLGFKYRAQLDNTLGVIDGDYYFADNEGHIMIKITNDSKIKSKTMTVKAGTGFAQGIFLEYGVTEDDDADGIRNGGFGSTTK